MTLKRFKEHSLFLSRKQEFSYLTLQNFEVQHISAARKANLLKQTFCSAIHFQLSSALIKTPERDLDFLSQILLSRLCFFMQRRTLRVSLLDLI